MKKTIILPIMFALFSLCLLIIINKEEVEYKSLIIETFNDSEFPNHTEQKIICFKEKCFLDFKCEIYPGMKLYDSEVENFIKQLNEQHVK